jgi:hypothetical protein
MEVSSGTELYLQQRPPDAAMRDTACGDEVISSFESGVDDARVPLHLCHAHSKTLRGFEGAVSGRRWRLRRKTYRLALEGGMIVYLGWLRTSSACAGRGSTI